MTDSTNQFVGASEAGFQGIVQVTQAQRVSLLRTEKPLSALNPGRQACLKQNFLWQKVEGAEPLLFWSPDGQQMWEVGFKKSINLGDNKTYKVKLEWKTRDFGSGIVSVAETPFGNIEISHEQYPGQSTHYVISKMPWTNTTMLGIIFFDLDIAKGHMNAYLTEKIVEMLDNGN
jgi:hypothetical protein